MVQKDPLKYKSDNFVERVNVLKHFWGDFIWLSDPLHA